MLCRARLFSNDVKAHRTAPMPKGIMGISNAPFALIEVRIVSLTFKCQIFHFLTAHFIARFWKQRRLRFGIVAWKKKTGYPRKQPFFQVLLPPGTRRRENLRKEGSCEHWRERVLHVVYKSLQSERTSWLNILKLQIYENPPSSLFNFKKILLVLTSGKR